MKVVDDQEQHRKHETLPLQHKFISYEAIARLNDTLRVIFVLGLGLGLGLRGQQIIAHAMSCLCEEIQPIFVTGSGKRDIFALIFKIELLAPQGRVSSQL